MKAERNFDGKIVKGYRLNENGKFIPLFAGNVDEFIKEREKTPYLKYQDEIINNINLLCVVGSFFNRPDSETWIIDENIKVLRDMPNRKFPLFEMVNKNDEWVAVKTDKYDEERELFAQAIEVFLSLQLLDDYYTTKNLF